MKQASAQRPIWTSLLILFIPFLANAMVLRGNIAKNNDNELVSFSLTVGDRNNYYSLSGSSSTDKGMIWSAIDFSFIEAAKTVGGESITFENGGILQVYSRSRQSDGLVLFGNSISGKFIQGSMDDRIEFTDLSVDGIASSGEMNYNGLSGRYFAQNNFRFGEYEIRPIQHNNAILDYDNILGQNAMVVSMVFGDLVVDGRINYTDTTATSLVYDTEDGFTTETRVAATNGTTNLRVYKLDGSEPKFSGNLQEDSKDDRTMQALLAFIQMINFDLSAE